jgi:hypothetical protein
MTGDYLQGVFDTFDAAARAAREQDNKWLIIDCIYEHLDDLSIYDFHDVLARILALVERFPDLDYGGPGPFGSYIEEQPFRAYTPQLLTSLQRQPSTAVLGWLDRSMSVNDVQNGFGPNPVSREQFHALLAEIIRDSRADESCRSFAQLCLDTPR